MCTTQDGDDRVAVEVSLPEELLDDIDRFAVQNGYATPGAVVEAALESRRSD